ncbi:Electron transfer flavoprotein subunit beta [Erysiphe neolycopersici]|uniref:Probable electron transfer flavoprotein subunit beta n=1 Tax=Erysiphe neolycopersici TaxID=212602 RepID=A0A420HEC1_9PEZI|nr:Electron transfer flavoprotein subunit beta [Erysiphe neolycopersici]
MSKLRILVPVKRVIDYAVKPRVNSTKTAVVTAGVKHSLNPFDEISLEEAVKMRERHVKQPSKSNPKVEEIIAFSVGPTKSIETLRTAMAMGADRSIFVEVKEGEEPESLGVAKLLANIVKREKINLVLAGKQSIDSDAGSVGGMLGGLLGWGFAGQACKITFRNPNVCIIEKEVDGGTETVEGHLPMVITADLRLNEPRYASLSNIMKAKKKKVDKITAQELGVDAGRRLLTREVTEPIPRQGGGKVNDVDGMIKRLKELHAI